MALRSIDGNLARTASTVTAWYRLAPQPWSFRSDSQRETLIRQIATQLGELQGRWLHVRVTSRPYPVALWAEAFDHNAPGRMPDVAGSLGWDAFLEGEQRHLMGLSMSDKEVFLGVEVSGRSAVDRWLESVSPVLRRIVPSAAAAELSALESEIAHIEALVSRPGLDGVPATAEDMAWLMHRSCSLGLPAPRTVTPAAGEHWETEDLAAFTDGVALAQEPYAPTVQVLGRFGTQPVQRHVAVLSVGLMDGLHIPESDDPWMQRSDRLPFPVEWSARVYVRRPEEVSGELQRQMGKVRSQIRHYTHDHDLDPPMSLSRQADRVLQIEDEISGGLTQIHTRVYGWWRIAVSGRDEPEALTRAQQVLDVYRPRVAVEHPEAQYAYAREFIPGEPLASTAYRRRGSVTWVAAGVPTASASVGDRRGIMLGETCTATRRPVAWDPWMAQEVRRASGLTAIVGGLGSGKALALDTPLPTPEGWTTMGEVAVGDRLLGRNGTPTTVVAATEVMHDRRCYDVEFSDGSVIRADAQHEWSTGGAEPVVHTTERIAASLASGGPRPTVAVAAAFDLPDADLPLDPYVLGVWLGCGTPGHATITTTDPELVLQVEATGQECRPKRARHVVQLLDGARTALRRLGLLDDRHIPISYLRASEAQRRDLLAGLMDAAGDSTLAGVELAVPDERLARGARELAIGLGHQARVLPGDGVLPTARPLATTGITPAGPVHSVPPDATECTELATGAPSAEPPGTTGAPGAAPPAFRVLFASADKVFRLPRKLMGQSLDARRANAYREITRVTPVESVPVRCVQVDNAHHLYLAGETCIPTHNSFLTGLLVYKTLRAGARWTVLDPSGPLAELSKLPELAPFSRHIHLLGADPGILNPYRVVAEPRRDHFLDEDDPEKAWRRERSLAAATRRRLVLDVLTGLLPFDVARMPHTRIVLLRAVREVGGGQDRDPGQVITVLRRHAREGGNDAEHAAVIADFLDERRELPQAALLFPDRSQPDPWRDEENYRLTVLTMQGMALPRPGSPREEWTDGEALAVELLNLASWLTQRTIYTADRNLRKGVALDETHFLSQIATGKVLIDRLARDSRKFNVRALFASQLAGDLLRVPGFASLVNAVFVGRTDDAEAQAEALRLLRVPTEVGYEEMLGTLSPRPTFQRHGHDDRPDDTPRQFVFADGHGGVEKIRIDLEGPHLEHVRETLDTNPDARRVRPSPAAPPVPVTPAATVPPETDVERTGPIPAVPAPGEPVHRPTDRNGDLEDLPDDLDDLPADLDDEPGAPSRGPAAGSPPAADPGAPDPDVADPDVADPDVADPDVAGPDVADPDAQDPEMPWADAWLMDTVGEGGEGPAVSELADEPPVVTGVRPPGSRP